MRAILQSVLKKYNFILFDSLKYNKTLIKMYLFLKFNGQVIDLLFEKIYNYKSWTKNMLHVRIKTAKYVK